MTLRQKLIIGIVLALAGLALRPFGAGILSLFIPAPRVDVSTEFGQTAGPKRPAEALSQETCRWAAAQMLAQAGLGGTATLNPDGLLCLNVTYIPLPDETSDAAAQLVWGAFDVALALQQRNCEFTQIEVVILTRCDQSGARIEASVGAADLAAFGAGELSEDEFIECVMYTTLSQ